jgi:hypothetical protein
LSQSEKDVWQVNRGWKGAAAQVAAKFDLAVVNKLHSPVRIGERRMLIRLIRQRISSEVRRVERVPGRKATARKTSG